MSAVTNTTRRQADTVTHDPGHGTLGALEAARRDNADLRRRLARAHRENDQLRHPTPTRVGERRAQWRDALAEPWSRNP